MGFPGQLVRLKLSIVSLNDRGSKIDHVIELQVDDDALVGRIEKRAKETGQARKDDNAETLRARLEVYHASTAPLLPYYKEKGALKTVNGMASMPEVAEAIEKIVN